MWISAKIICFNHFIIFEMKFNAVLLITTITSITSFHPSSINSGFLSSSSQSSLHFRHSRTKPTSSPLYSTIEAPVREPESQERVKTVRKRCYDASSDAAEAKVRVEGRPPRPHDVLSPLPPPSSGLCP